MKKFLKILKIVVLIIPCLFVFTACGYDKDDLRIVSIVQTGYTTDSAEYLITYKDGETLKFTVPINNTVSIASIAKTKTDKNKDTYTITLTNGETTDFEVTNGVSVESIAYSRTVGLVDYYKITYSNGTTSEYSITNGKDGADGVSLEDMYKEAKKTKNYNNISEFIEDYLNININADTTQVATGKAILSAVSIYSKTDTSSVAYSDTFKKWVKVNGISAGSGVIYSLDKTKGDAYIITNCHVVYDEKSVDSYSNNLVCYLYGMEGDVPYEYQLNEEATDYVYDNNGCVQVDFNNYAIPCTIIGASIQYDIAVLKVENSEVVKNSNARAINVANSNQVVVGENAIAIGNPKMAGISATSGIISVISEYIQVSIDAEVDTVLREFRIDTAVNSGNSGGGLFNNKGELIGIVNAKTSDDSVENMGYAIPSNIAKYLADNIIYNYEKDGYFGVKKAIVGIVLNAKTSKSVYNASTLTTEIIEEVEVQKVQENSIAEQIGFQNGDIIKSVSLTHNEEVTNLDITRYFQLIDFFLTVREGDTMQFTIMGTQGETTLSYTFGIEDFVAVK